MDIWRGIFFVLSNLETVVSNSFWDWFQLSITILFSLIVFCKYFVKYAPSSSAIDLALSVNQYHLFQNIENFASFKNWWKPVYFNPKAQKLPIETSKKQPYIVREKGKSVR